MINDRTLCVPVGTIIVPTLSLLSFPFKYRAEKLYRKDRIYDLLINIKYNFSPVVKKKGSAIFLHISNKINTPTKGCVAIPKTDFLKILPLIKNKTRIEFF